MYEGGEVMCKTVTYSVLYTTMKHQLVPYYLLVGYNKLFFVTGLASLPVHIIMVVPFCSIL